LFSRCQCERQEVRRLLRGDVADGAKREVAPAFAFAFEHAVGLSDQGGVTELDVDVFRAGTYSAERHA